MNLKSIKSWLPATLQIGLCAVGIALPLLVACGGKMSPGDTPSTAAGTAPFEATGTENFLVFPNPLANPAIDTWGTAGTYEDTYYNMIVTRNMGKKEIAERHWKRSYRLQLWAGKKD